MVVVTALLDNHDLVAVAVTAMPTTIMVHMGACAVPAMMMVMAAALDDDRLCAGDRRCCCNHERANGCNDQSKLPHDVSSNWVNIKLAMRGNVPEELQENSERVFRRGGDEVSLVRTIEIRGGAPAG
jgi:hypothetical protein